MEGILLPLQWVEMGVEGTEVCTTLKVLFAICLPF